VVSGFGLSQPKIESDSIRGFGSDSTFCRNWIGFCISEISQIQVQVGLSKPFLQVKIPCLATFIPALTLSQVWIWTWIQFVLQFGSDSESIKFNGFGLGFNLFYRLGRIWNPLKFNRFGLEFNLFYRLGQIRKS